MSEQGTEKQFEEKGPTWVYFVTLLQVGRERKTPEAKKENLREAVATATTDIESGLLHSESYHLSRLCILAYAKIGCI